MTLNIKADATDEQLTELGGSVLPLRPCSIRSPTAFRFPSKRNECSSAQSLPSPFTRPARVCSRRAGRESESASPACAGPVRVVARQGCVSRRVRRQIVELGLRGEPGLYVHVGHIRLPVVRFDVLPGAIPQRQRGRLLHHDAAARFDWPRTAGKTSHYRGRRLSASVAPVNAPSDRTRSTWFTRALDSPGLIRAGQWVTNGMRVPPSKMLWCLPAARHWAGACQASSLHHRCSRRQPRRRCRSRQQSGCC